MLCYVSYVDIGHVLELYFFIMPLIIEYQSTFHCGGGHKQVEVLNDDTSVELLPRSFSNLG